MSNITSYPAFLGRFGLTAHGENLLVQRLKSLVSLSIAVFGLGWMIASAVLAQSGDFTFRPPSPSGSYLAGQEALDDLRTRDAASYLLDATEREWDNSAVIERALAALAADGRIGDAEDIARHMLELIPEHDLAKLLLGTVALKERRYRSAIAQLETVGLDNFVGITAMVMRAWAHVGEGELPQAYEVLDEMGNGLEGFLVFHRALMADISGSDEALGLIAVAHNADPYLARMVEARARMLGNRSEFSAALDVISDYEREGLSHPGVDLVFESIAAGRRPGRFADSVQSGAAELYLGMGAALARDGAPDVAMVFLQLGHYLSPESDSIAMTIGQLLDNSGEHLAANQVYEAIPRDSTLKPEAIVRAAENLDSLGDRNEAIRRLSNITQVQPNDITALSSLADLLRLDGQLDRAIEAYSSVIDLVGGDRPRDWRYFYVRGIAYQQNDQWPEAEADLQRALELNPTQPQVLNYLGYSWVDQGLHLSIALDLIEQAVSANPRDGYIVDSLGWVFYKLDRYEEAVEVLEEAVRLLPNDPEINDHLGDAYWRAGRRLEARYQWAIGLDMDIAGDVTERVGPKLEHGLPDLDA